MMICKIINQIRYTFYWSIKKWSKLDWKTLFLLILRGFLFTHAYTLWITTQAFVKWKTLWRCIFVVSFISIAYKIVMSKIFEVFHFETASMKWSLLGVFSGPYFPKYCLILLKIWPEVVSIKTVGKSQSLKNLLKYFFLAPMGRNQNLQFWSIFLESDLLSENQRRLLNTKNSAKTASLVISNDVSHRS